MFCRLSGKIFDKRCKVSNLFLTWTKSTHISLVLRLFVSHGVMTTRCFAAEELHWNYSCDSDVLLSCFVLVSSPSAQQWRRFVVVSISQAYFANHQQENLDCIRLTITTLHIVSRHWFQMFSGLHSVIFDFSPLHCRATSNNKVKDMVLLELSYVNSNLQLLMGQLEGLNSSVDVYQNTQWVHMLLLHWFSSCLSSCSWTALPIWCHRALFFRLSFSISTLLTLSTTQSHATSRGFLITLQLLII